MLLTIIALLVMSVSFIAIGLYIRYRTNNRKTVSVQEAAGSYKTMIGRTLVKNANKQKIVQYIDSKGRANNAELRELLGVTGRTVVRYMDELEKEGKVLQMGGTGRGVFYHRRKL